MMRPVRPRPLITHPVLHSKPSRRSCSLLTSNLDVSIRFTSIFVIAVAFCEFSGLAQVVADAYTATNLRLATSSPSASSAPPFSVRPPVSHLADMYDAMVAPRRHKRAALENLYRGLGPDESVERALLTRRAPPKPSKPSFLFELHWAEDNFYDKVCRVHNACLKRDGTLVVHPSLKKHKRKLAACGVQRLAYLSSPGAYNASAATAGYDLFGLHPARYHIPHFLTDILPMVYAAELLRPTGAHASARSLCESVNGEACSAAALAAKLHPAIHVEDRVRLMPVSMWVPQLAAMLAGHPHMIFPSGLPAEGEKPACFRSVVAFNSHSYIRRGSEWFGEQNRMFESHGLTRASVLRKPPDGGPPAVTVRKGDCRVRVAVLNRVGWVMRSGFLLGRDLVNVEEVTQRIGVLARKTKGMQLRTEVHFFENKSFVEQVDVVQRADVVLGVHGAGLGNLLFARKDVPVLEVLPFAYYAGPFQSVAQALYLRYSFIVGEPDTMNFLECMERRARKVGDEGVAAKGRELWEEAVRRRRETGELGFLKAHKFTDPYLAHIKMCARTQRMRVDAEDTARRVVEMARRVCGIDGKK